MRNQKGLHNPSVLGLREWGRIKRGYIASPISGFPEWGGIKKGYRTPAVSEERAGIQKGYMTSATWGSYSREESKSAAWPLLSWDLTACSLC